MNRRGGYTIFLQQSSISWHMIWEFSQLEFGTEGTLHESERKENGVRHYLMSENLVTAVACVWW